MMCDKKCVMMCGNDDFDPNTYTLNLSPIIASGSKVYRWNIKGWSKNNSKQHFIQATNRNEKLCKQVAADIITTVKITR